MKKLTLVLMFAAVSVLAQTGLTERNWMVDGLKRQALVYVPPSAAVSNTPLIFAFHGHGGNRLSMAKSFPFNQLWPEAISVFMQGVKSPGTLVDTEGLKTGWQNRAGDFGDRDLRFFDTVLADLQKSYKIDPARIYATGYSHGGYFTYLLWAERGDRLAAVAPCAAVATPRILPLLKPKPVLHLAGKGDHLVKWEWQQLTFDALRRLNGCGTEGQPWAATGTVTATLYTGSNGLPVVTAVHPGSHGLPPGAADVVALFFKEAGQ